MADSLPSPLTLSKAYQEINFYPGSSEQPIALHTTGPAQFRGLFKTHPSHQHQSVSIEKQALYQEEVDHRIEEVGIMAVKQVKYLTESQWEKMMERQKQGKGGEEDAQELWKMIEKACKYEARHRLAKQRERNEKGQFLKKEHKPIKQKGIKKRGRPCKTKSK